MTTKYQVVVTYPDGVKRPWGPAEEFNSMAQLRAIEVRGFTSHPVEIVPVEAE